MNCSSKFNTLSYTQELNFEQAINTDIASLWQRREEGVMSSFDKTKIQWCKLTSDTHTKAIVVVNGRIESTLKYQELFFDLFQQGYDVYSYDHRGQGLSEALIENHQMGHIVEFDDYVADLNAIVTLFDLSRYQSRFLLAHSMGGAIVTRFIQTHPEHSFNAIALSAPMFGVNVPRYLKPFAIIVAQLLTAIKAHPMYAPGHQAYYSKPFEDNPLSQSKVRYQWFRQLYEDIPTLKVGGPSTRWVWQALTAAKQCIQQTRQIRLPLLLLQAGDDKIVSNEHQIKFIKKLAKTNSKCAFKIIHGARHELLFEQDRYRNSSLDCILNFYAEHQSHNDKTS